MNDYKNRKREKASFGNINLLGKCNLKCYFCLGNEIDNRDNYLNTHFNKWKNFNLYLDLLKKDNINKVYLTGCNTDPLLYKYLDELIDYLKISGFNVGIRTNGLLTEQHIDTINKINDKYSISVHSFNKQTNRKITKLCYSLDLDRIIKSIKVPIRIAIVVNRYNYNEILDMIEYLSKYKLSYIQLRCIATDKNYDMFKEDIEKYECLEKEIDKKFKIKRDYYTSKIYDIYGIEVSLWRTIKTTINSYNYFVNGLISDNYFIVEGYDKNRKSENL